MAVRFCFAFTRDIGEEALETLSSIPCFFTQAECKYFLRPLCPVLRARFGNCNVQCSSSHFTFPRIFSHLDPILRARTRVLTMMEMSEAPASPSVLGKRAFSIQNKILGYPAVS